MVIKVNDHSINYLSKIRELPQVVVGFYYFQEIEDKHQLTVSLFDFMTGKCPLCLSDVDTLSSLMSHPNVTDIECYPLTDIMDKTILRELIFKMLYHDNTKFLHYAVCKNFDELLVSDSPLRSCYESRYNIFAKPISIPIDKKEADRKSNAYRLRNAIIEYSETLYEAALNNDIILDSNIVEKQHCSHKTLYNLCEYKDILSANISTLQCIISKILDKDRSYLDINELIRVTNDLSSMFEEQTLPILEEKISWNTIVYSSALENTELTVSSNIRQICLSNPYLDDLKQNELEEILLYLDGLADPKFDQLKYAIHQRCKFY